MLRLIISLKLVEVGVGGGVTEIAAHGYDLAFVVEGVSEHVMEDERRGADSAVSI